MKGFSTFIMLDRDRKYKQSDMQGFGKDNTDSFLHFLIGSYLSLHILYIM